MIELYETGRPVGRQPNNFNTARRFNTEKKKKNTSDLISLDGDLEEVHVTLTFLAGAMIP